ncbi:low molecular weight protein-tyrosine-phosphatase [Alteribacillus sp. YIM 98480]|uniref:low molecular weight protein-tyrosine-phosphatase n=1 Tax=Alteribacillus sp. YIM 98480 TaxID=2606599 RepID=UPI00131AA93B|nr:low molecular weight protein-tyrosine-phosphatase [Alteribacillus sp. YIM 98480]
MKINVLFVCLGNICRSPMAEAVFRKKVSSARLSDQIQMDSAGTGHWHIGKPPHEGTRSILKKKAVSYEGIIARQISTDDFKNFTYIISMDEANISEVEKLQKGKTDTLYAGKLLDFHPEFSGGDVPDPYLTGNFEEVYDMVDLSCTNLLAWIRRRESV